MRIGLALLAIVVAGCAGGAADSSTADAPGEGGNVSFGGAADIGYFRQAVAEGRVPEFGSLDANGFFNEHYVELPNADCGQALCLPNMVSVARDWIYNQPQSLVQLALTTPATLDDFPVLPKNITVIVDTSGSMSTDNRIEYVRQGLHAMIDNLESGDKLSIVEYNSSVTVHNELEDDESLMPSFLHATVDGLTPTGATNIDAALQTALSLALQSASSETEDRVIFLSDGRPTVGQTNTQAILENVEPLFADGIALTTIGVGSDFNFELMRRLAEIGSGNQYFLEDEMAVTSVFTDELDYFFAPLATNVELAIQLSPDSTLNRVVGSNQWTSSNNGGKLELGAVFFSRRKSAEPDPGGRRGGGSSLFIDFEPGEFSNEPVASVALDYVKSADSTEQMERLFVARPPAVDTNPYFSETAMGKHFAMYNVYRGLSLATYFAQFDPACANETLSRVIERAEFWNSVPADPDIASDIELMHSLLENLPPSAPVIDFDSQCVERDDNFFNADSLAVASCQSGSSSILWLLLPMVAIRRRL